jgi:hypothetical protein
MHLLYTYHEVYRDAPESASPVNPLRCACAADQGPEAVVLFCAVQTPSDLGCAVESDRALLTYLQQPVHESVFRVLWARGVMWSCLVVKCNILFSAFVDSVSRRVPL